jgi:hypothetical protein
MAVRADTVRPEQSSEDTIQKKKSGPFWARDDWSNILPDTVLDHLHFHRDSMRYSQRISRALDGAIIVFSAAIPVLAATPAPQAVLGGLGALVTVLAALGHQFGWKDNWIRQNRVIMAIQQELVWYRNGKLPYDGSTSEVMQKKLALRVEELVQADAETWAVRLEERDKEERDKEERDKEERDKDKKEPEGDRNHPPPKADRPSA